MDSFGVRTPLRVGAQSYEIWSLEAMERRGYPVSRMPMTLRILLENVLRNEDGASFEAEDAEALARWTPEAPSVHEIAFRPARVLLQDFTGVPALVDLAAMRDAMAALGGQARQIDPVQPAELVVDHSVQVDAWGSPDALRRNLELEHRRNAERYAFLKWGQRGFSNLRVVPPNTGICHQVNLEHLARVVFAAYGNGVLCAYPDTVVGTDSHTPMVNGLGVLGWGVGGIEAEAAMLGQPLSMTIPPVVGLRLEGRLREGTTATDLVLTVCERLRRKGVVGRFVEFFGPGVSTLGLADRATVANMAPEYGATCAVFPIDDVTLAYLRFTGRPRERVALVEAYAKAQGLFGADLAATYSDVVTIDLGEVEPSLAGPRRPQDRVPLHEVAANFRATLPSLLPLHQDIASPGVACTIEGRDHALGHGAVVIAAITSCTNTSNPDVMIAAGLLARNAVAKGLTAKPWVKTSLAPGSKVVVAYLDRAGLAAPLEQLGFHLVGFGCTTCIGNSGPLPPEVSEAIHAGGLVAAAVLSGNRNFEGRIHAEVRANYLASPPLVVAYAIAGRIDVDLVAEPLGVDASGVPVYLRDVWPSDGEVARTVAEVLRSEMFTAAYAHSADGDERWRALVVPEGERYTWDPNSTYVARPPYFDGVTLEPPNQVRPIRGARVLAFLGDSVTTDHISPAGDIRPASPAGAWLGARGVAADDLHTYGARRGHHEVMVRGTFASARLRNRLVPGVEGGFTRVIPGGDVVSIWEAAERYRAAGVPLIVLAGKEYGTGSSRDWAAKGPALQGVVAVLAESFERIHRSNLVGMGIVPLRFSAGESAATLGLTGDELFEVEGIEEALATRAHVIVVARRVDGTEVRFAADALVDTPQEVLYYRHGGILPYVLRQLLGGHETAQAVSKALPAAVFGAEAVEAAGAVEEGSEQSFPASDPPAW